MAQTLLPATSIESLATASYFLFDEVEERQQPTSGVTIADPTTAHTHGRPEFFATNNTSNTNNSNIHPTTRHQKRPSTNYHNNYTTPAARWTALTTRDPAATDTFIYAVRTTKIYCRPDCRARLARRANVAFYDNAHQARADGYRACKRCKPDADLRHTKAVKVSVPAPAPSNSDGAELAIAPDQNQTQEPPTNPGEDEDDARTKIKHAVQMIQQSALQGSKLSLAQLSKEVGWSKWHLHRVFKQLQGMTPREMADGMTRTRNEPLPRRDGDDVDANAIPALVDMEMGMGIMDDDLPVLSNGSNWIDGFESSGRPIQDSAPDVHTEVEEGLFSVVAPLAPLPPLTPLLSTTPSTDDALTPTPTMTPMTTTMTMMTTTTTDWSDEMFSYDPLLFSMDGGGGGGGGVKDQDVGLEGLLSDLFPELFGERV